MAEEEKDQELDEQADGEAEDTEGDSGEGAGGDGGKQVVSFGKYQRETKALKEQIEALRNPKPDDGGKKDDKPADKTADETPDLGALSKELADLKAELASRDLDKALTKALRDSGVSDTDLAATYLIAKGARLKDGALEGVDLEGLKASHPSLFAPDKKGSSGPKPGGAMGGESDLEERIDKALHLK